jgi:hypothetical protein
VRSETVLPILAREEKEKGIRRLRQESPLDIYGLENPVSGLTEVVPGPQRKTDGSERI